jgi:hypothetical protein
MTVPQKSNNQLSIIKNFINSNEGIQRANRYGLEFNFRNKFPGDTLTNTTTLTTSIGQTNYNSLEMYPSAISFGARAINYVYDNLQGPNYGRAVPNSSKYVGGVVLTFLVTGNLNPMNFFYSWMDQLYRSKNVGSQPFIGSQPSFISYYKEFTSGARAEIKFLDLNGNRKQSWFCEEVYPVECMPIELSAKADSPLLFQVVLNYRNIYRGSIQ